MAEAGPARITAEALRQRPGWPVPDELLGQRQFQVLFTARGPYSDALVRDA